MSEGEMRFSPNGIFKRADDLFQFCIEWQVTTARLLMTNERTYEAGAAKMEDAKVRKAWVEKREMERYPSRSLRITPLQRI